MREGPDRMSDTRGAVDETRERQNHLESDSRALAVFAGLVPSIAVEREGLRSRVAVRARSAAFTSVPVMLTGAIALGIGLAGPIEPAHARKPVPPKPEQSPTPLGLRSALTQLAASIVPGALAASTVITTAAPASYRVEPGDTVSSVSQRFGLSTASVLALNGLSWRSTIFPGQVLTLTTAPVKTTAPPPARTSAGQYTIVKGDTVSAIAARFGVSTNSILTTNGLNPASIIYPGQSLAIPGREPATNPSPAAVIGLAADVPIEPPSPALATVTETESAASTPATPSTAVAVAALAIAERPTLPSSSASRTGAPRPTASAPSGPPSGGTVTPLTAEMRTHAETIIRVGHELGVPQYGIVIALATAMQESTLRNLSWGDRDSVGLFQQRPSSGWGTAADLQIPSHAARLFYVGRPGYTRGLLGISGWQGMTLTRAAQAVQISAYPDHYAKWETSAWAWYYELT